MADKLQHLPPPGEANDSWEQMRALLEKEMPRGGGFSVRRHWWLFSIAIGILFLGTWLSGKHFLEGDKTIPVTQTLPPVDPEKGKPLSPAGKAQSSGTAAQSPDNPPVATAPAEGTVKSREKPVTPPGSNAAVSERDEGAAVATVRDAGNKIRNNQNNNRQPRADETITTQKDNRNYTREGNKKLSGGRTQPKTPADLDPAFTDQQRERNLTRGTTRKPLKQDPKVIYDKAPVLSKPAEDRVHATTVRSPLRYTNSQPGPVLAPGTTIEKDYAKKNGLPDRPVANAGAAKKKLQRSRETGMLAMGFTLPLAFPLGDQRAMGYNLWAGHNTVSDYLPSPHLQYHLSGKTFLQTEAQLISPQFIRSTLLEYTVRPLGPNSYTTNAVYAKKLYYFNIPVSIHHSPFPGFYMGTGIQFSSMISGVALSEERKWTGGGNVLVKETYSRFRNDSLSQRINSNEFRLLLDANYFFNRFTVGLRYNQALSNYLSFRLSPATPYTFDKNRALQFYLRYNLWESKKSSNSGKTLLTLK
ncbi:hypothetical protein HB364_03850 [Pseudoflavitalea sp. X16]|uniref:hypothetical protein n=1 Tax=Paraflavitalea devenefica TaxID=2716334 RepID=UPI00141DA021|nr:hypothetical protein [Paraflavitalea devenefica]NII24195.1 hypothetical protein [Paraflavitalea devenefica]